MGKTPTSKVKTHCPKRKGEKCHLHSWPDAQMQTPACLRSLLSVSKSSLLTCKCRHSRSVFRNSSCCLSGSIKGEKEKWTALTVIFPWETSNESVTGCALYLHRMEGERKVQGLKSSFTSGPEQLKEPAPQQKRDQTRMYTLETEGLVQLSLFILRDTWREEPKLLTIIGISPKTTLPFLPSSYPQRCTIC